MKRKRNFSVSPLRSSEYGGFGKANKRGRAKRKVITSLFLTPVSGREWSSVSVRPRPTLREKACSRKRVVDQCVFASMKVANCMPIASFRPWDFFLSLWIKYVYWNFRKKIGGYLGGITGTWCGAIAGYFDSPASQDVWCGKKLWWEALRRRYFINAALCEKIW